MIGSAVQGRLLMAIALSIGAASCSSGATSMSTSTSTAADGGPTTTIATGATAPAGAGTTGQDPLPPPAPAPAVVVGKPASDATATSTVDGAALLASSFNALAGGYHFTTTVTIGGVVSVVADGDRVGADTRLTITSNGGAVSYLITAAGSWASTAGEPWEQLDSPPASADPIEALRAPTAVTVAASDATSSQLTVVVPAASLGVPGGADTTLQVVIVGPALQQIGYETVVNGQPATVQAIIGPLTDTTPITAPA